MTDAQFFRSGLPSKAQLHVLNRPVSMIQTFKSPIELEYTLIFILRAGDPFLFRVWFFLSANPTLFIRLCLERRSPFASTYNGDSIAWTALRQDVLLLVKLISALVTKRRIAVELPFKAASLRLLHPAKIFLD